MLASIVKWPAHAHMYCQYCACCKLFWSLLVQHRQLINLTRSRCRQDKLPSLVQTVYSGSRKCAQTWSERISIKWLNKPSLSTANAHKRNKLIWFGDSTGQSTIGVGQLQIRMSLHCTGPAMQFHSVAIIIIYVWLCLLSLPHSHIGMA